MKANWESGANRRLSGRTKRRAAGGVSRVPPPDLYATSDIRFVMLKIGELMTKVDTLISDVEKHGDKIDQVRHQISFVKGALWVLGGVVAAISLAVIWYFTGKLSITFTSRKFAHSCHPRRRPSQS